MQDRQTPTPVPSQAARPFRIVLVATEDWFVASHFLPMIRTARERGFEVVVATRIRDHGGAIAAAGARVVPLEVDRRSVGLIALTLAVSQLTAILRREHPDLVHCIALKSILVGGIAARRAGVERRLYAITGFGLLGARVDIVGRIARAFLRFAIRFLLTGPKTHFMFENTRDPSLLGLSVGDPSVTIVGGAGVDPDELRPTPLPPAPPLRIGVVSRMLWSKGIDLAVTATSIARAQGIDVRLSLFGSPDPDNPKFVAIDILEGWAAMDGITWHGRVASADLAWQHHHVCCLPSRGGEGLPRTLLEGAACGRAIVTTDVPGCAEFVRDGVEGKVVAANDAGALADAFIALAADPEGVARMGAAARERVLGSYTERHVMRVVGDLYARMMTA